MSSQTPLIQPQPQPTRQQQPNANKNPLIKLVFTAILAAVLILMVVNLLDNKYHHKNTINNNNSNNRQNNNIIMIEGSGNESEISHGRVYQSLQQARNSMMMGSALIQNYQPIHIQNESSNKMVRVDRNSKYLPFYTIDGNQLTYNGPSQKWTQLLAYKPIPTHTTFHTTIQILFSAHSHLILGITPKSRINQQSSYFNHKTYAYYGNNGCVWAQGELMMKDQSKGFKEKDVVEIVVQLWRGLVEWRVNGKIVGQVYSKDIQDMINNNKKNKNQEKSEQDGSQNQNKQQLIVEEYVPYIEMFQKGDQIRIIE